MGLTLLQMTQTALRENADFNVPTTIVGNTDPTAVRLLAIANRTVKALTRQYTWQAMFQSYSFPTVVSTATYALPSAFQRFLSLTFWDNTNLRTVRGPVTPALWQALQSGNLSAPIGVTKFFRVAANLFAIYPTPTAVETIAYQYIGKYAVDGNADGTADKELFTLDADQCVLSDDLMTLGIRVRYLASIGAPIDLELAEFKAALDAEIAADGGKDVIKFGPAFMQNPYGGGNLPESSFGS